MKYKGHVNLSISLQQFDREDIDLRVSLDQSVQEFILSIMEVLYIPSIQIERFAIRIKTKELVLFDTEYLYNYPISDGDCIEII